MGRAHKEIVRETVVRGGEGSKYEIRTVFGGNNEEREEKRDGRFRVKIRRKKKRIAGHLRR